MAVSTPGSRLVDGVWIERSPRRVRVRFGGEFIADSTDVLLVWEPRRLEALEQTSRAFARGDIGLEHAAVVTKTAAQLGDEVIRAAEPDLLQAARSLDSYQLGRVARYLRHLHDPEGFEEDERALHEGASRRCAARGRGSGSRVGSSSPPVGR